MPFLETSEKDSINVEQASSTMAGKVENNPYDPSLMVFMDYRDYTKQKVPGMEIPIYLLNLPGYLCRNGLIYPLGDLYLILSKRTLHLVQLRAWSIQPLNKLLFAEVEYMQNHKRVYGLDINPRAVNISWINLYFNVLIMTCLGAMMMQVVKMMNILGDL